MPFPSYTPPTPTAGQLDAMFPGKNTAPPQGTFEVGLVLAGTVSAGAYTAGVIDFLTEALDAWDIALEAKDPLAPASKLVLKVVSGASGGGVIAAILGRVSPYAFPHVHASTDNKSTGNLFYDVWVNKLDVTGMLSTEDLSNNKRPASVLNVAPIDDAGKMLVQFVGHPLGEVGSGTPATRRWLDPTLSIFLTMTNLRGLPYKIDFNGGASVDPRLQQNFVNHADFVRFELDTRPEVSTPVRPDAFGVSLWRTGDAFVGWDTVAPFGVATGAFPIGFKARNLSRPLDHYAYRIVTTTDANGATCVQWFPPDWDALRDDAGNLSPVYNFPCVDGGGTDNSPVELARTALAGVCDRNPRDGKIANRAVILVDPFAEKTSLGPETLDDLVSTLFPFVFGLIGEARYATADLLLAADNDVFSRFMVTARRGELTGSPALATSGLGAFQGFLCRDFREHDYFLGRRNAYDFLKNQFALPDSNPLFETWSVDQKAKLGAASGGVNYLPIIPLFGTAATPPQYPVWPAGKLDPETLADPIKERLETVLSALENTEISSNFFIKALLWPVVSQLDSRMFDAIMAAIKKSLKNSNL
jgi:hypothetical protein